MDRPDFGWRKPRREISATRTKKRVNCGARHWEKIYRAINIPWKGGGLQNLTLYHLEQNDIYDHKELVQEISSTASGENTLEMSLAKVRR